MSVALDQGILKCISTDTIRSTMRSFIPEDISPALHRSSYAPASEDDDPVRSWKETCRVLEASVEELVNDALRRGVGLVLEGVSILPSDKMIKKWEDGGGVAVGCLLTVHKEETHKALLQRRGVSTGENSGQQQEDETKIKSFNRIRLIQDEMIKLAEEANWLLIEQKVEPDPLEIIDSRLRAGDQASNDVDTDLLNNILSKASKKDHVVTDSIDLTSPQHHVDQHSVRHTSKSES